MRTMRTTDAEHRTLPILITVGMLLGVSLAVASPAQRDRVQRVDPASFTSPPAASVSASPARVPGFRTGVVDARTADEGAARACDPVPPGVLHEYLGSGLPRAAYALTFGCAEGRKGIATALEHVTDNAAKRQGHGDAGGHGRPDEEHGRGADRPDAEHGQGADRPDGHGASQPRNGDSAGDQARHGSGSGRTTSADPGDTRPVGGAPDRAGPPPSTG